MLRRIFGPKKRGTLQEDEDNGIPKSFITFAIMNLVVSYPFLYWHQSFTVQNLCLRISVKKSGFVVFLSFLKQTLCSLYNDFLYRDCMHLAYRVM